MSVTRPSRRPRIIDDYLSTTEQWVERTIPPGLGTVGPLPVELHP
jgi:hypothetical protein